MEPDGNSGIRGTRSCHSTPGGSAGHQSRVGEPMQVSSREIVPKKLLLRDRSAPVGLRVVTARRAASHWGQAEKRASRIRSRRFGESSFVALIHLPVALLFAYYHHAIENAQTRFVRSPWM